MADDNKINALGAQPQTEETKAEEIIIAFDEETESGGAQLSEEEHQAILDELERTYWSRMGKRILKDWRIYLMLIPLLLVFFLWRYLPLYDLIAAFKVDASSIPLWERDFVGLNWFRNLFSGPDAGAFWPAFRNTFVISFYGLLFGFPIPIILALFFNEVKNNVIRSGLQIFTYLPRFVSTVVVTTIIQLLLRNGQASPYMEPGILANLFSRLGWIDQETAWNGMLFVPSYFRPIYIVSGIWEGAGYGSIVYFAAIIGISPTNYEAAVIDGADKMAQIRYVVLPGIMSTVVIMLVLRLGELFSVGYEKVLLLYDKLTYSTADIVGTFVLQRAGIGLGSDANQALASSADLIAALISMTLVIGSNFISKRISKVSLY